MRRPGAAQPKEEKSGGSPGRVDNCDTKRGGKVECSSQAMRLWDMLMSWFLARPIKLFCKAEGSKASPDMLVPS